MLPHYVAKFDCLHVQLYSKVFQGKSGLFTVNVTRDVMFCFVCLHKSTRIDLQHVFKMSTLARMRALSRAFLLSRTFEFHKVVRQQTGGMMAYYIPCLLVQFIPERKSEKILKLFARRLY